MKPNRASRRSDRRGVLLLVVLGLLAMFGLVATTFVLLAGHERRGAEAQRRVGQFSDPPENLTHQVLLQVLRGSNNPASVLGPHSLLEDVYGPPAATTYEPLIAFGACRNAAGQYSSEIVDLGFNRVTGTNPSQLAELQKHVGRVLTFWRGPLEGQTVRIVGAVQHTDLETGYVYDCLQVAGLHGLTVRSAPFADGKASINGIAFEDASYRHAVLINGTAFAGMGFGYDPGAAAGSPLLTAAQTVSTTPWPFALLPNAATFPWTNADLGHNPLYTNPSGEPDPAGPGGANEEYDAPDFQNLLLAMQVPQPFTVNVAGIPFTIPAGTTPIPSLHRPELVNYWFHRLPDLLNAHVGGTSVFSTGTVPERMTWFLGLGSTVNGKTLPPEEQRYIRELRRRIILRPLPEYHPAFNEENPYFLPTWAGIHELDWTGDGLPELGPPPQPCADWDKNGQINVADIVPFRWDVDNDGDRVLDSIWVDVGLPVRPGPDGRLSKPLVAILCVDLDGRLNLNAHGSLAQTDANYDTPTQITNTSGNPLSIVAGGGNQLPRVRGQAAGPAEVDLRELLSAAHPWDATQTQYNVLLKGIMSVRGTLPGRYGLDDLTTMNNKPGWAGLPTPARGDWLAANTVSDRAMIYDPTVVADTGKKTGSMGYGTPLDLSGGVAVGLDLRGQPLYATLMTNDVKSPPIGVTSQPLNGLATTAYDTPYELQLYGGCNGAPGTGSADAPFSVAELDRLLRPYDGDGGRQHRRLVDLAPSLLEDNRWRLVTTQSWSVPAPAVSLPPELRQALQNNPAAAAWIDNLKANGVADLLRAKIVTVDASHFNNSNDADQKRELEERVLQLLPRELVLGLRMDLNRALGNGYDDNGNGVVDEPGEVEFCVQYNEAGAPVPGIPFNDVSDLTDLDNDGDVDAADQNLARQFSFGRQRYARGLYVLMLLATNYDPAGAGAAGEARRAAQWAVNVVDFRDRDAIMTPFEYDENPFDGWNVNGLLGTDDQNHPKPDDTGVADRGLVWGCERPELLISEALALHDRRTEDLHSGGGLVADNDDDDFDQRVKPQGSLFVEIYNPWSAAAPLPGEFYRDGGVDLTRTTGSGGAGSPVWRFAICMVDLTHPETTAEEPRDPDAPTGAPVPERAVYFVDSNAQIPPGAAAYRPTDEMHDKIAPIQPGRYAVVGPGEPTDTTQSTTYFGYRNGHTTGDDRTRRITLTPSQTVSGQQVFVSRTGTSDDLSGVTIQSATAIVVNSPRLSVTEPVAGYPDYDVMGAQPRYEPPKDEPLDRAEDIWDGSALNKVAVKDNSVYRGAWMLHLQRLANPLLPYDAQTNPYRTIDSMPIDLTSFNGLTNEQDTGDNTHEQGTDGDLFTRERGDKDNTNSRNVWAQDPKDMLQQDAKVARVGDAPEEQHYFNEQFGHTLGYLNSAYGAPLGSPTDYVGSPVAPFPWFTWLNRPFAGPAELMLVPSFSSSRLLVNVSTGAGTIDLYNDVDDHTPDPPGPPDDPDGEDDNNDNSFRHLVNFFGDGDDPMGDFNGKRYRLMEMLGVPSRFVGADLLGNPLALAAGNHAFHPPFNRISTYREPGRVNLNTIADQRVWKALVGKELASGTAGITTNASWYNFVISRCPGTTDPPGITDPNDKAMARMFQLVDTSPTRFENPFRSSAGRQLVPDTDTVPPSNKGLDDLIDKDVHATTLRKGPGGNDPLFNCQSALDAFNTSRNATFAHHVLNRIESLSTTQSNVYAVWITVGYFDVTPVQWPADANGLTQQEFLRIYPDGYKIGRERGTETGEKKRHRAFYIIDRSIPVGFQRGEDLNVEDAILLRRFVE